MMTVKSTTLQQAISIILLAGILLASLLVIYGGCSYLINNGSLSFNSLGVEKESKTVSLDQLGASIISFNSAGIIELGLIILVLTQFVRVGCLVLFYLANRDVKFTLISSFIFILLIYSFLWRHA